MAQYGRRKPELWAFVLLLLLVWIYIIYTYFGFARNYFVNVILTNMTCPTLGMGSAEPFNADQVRTQLRSKIKLLNSDYFELPSLFQAIGGRNIITTWANAEAAKHNLPLFLKSIYQSDRRLLKVLIVFCLDPISCSLCRRSHKDISCVFMDLGVPNTDLRPNREDVLSDTNSHYWRLTFSRLFTSRELLALQLPEISPLVAETDSEARPRADSKADSTALEVALSKHWHGANLRGKATNTSTSEASATKLPQPVDFIGKDSGSRQNCQWWNVWAKSCGIIDLLHNVHVNPSVQQNIGSTPLGGWNILAVDVDSIFFKNPFIPLIRLLQPSPSRIRRPPQHNTSASGHGRQPKKGICHANGVPEINSIACRPQDIAVVADVGPFTFKFGDKTPINGGFLYFPGYSFATGKFSTELLDIVWKENCRPEKNEQLVLSSALRKMARKYKFAPEHHQYEDDGDENGQYSKKQDDDDDDDDDDDKKGSREEVPGAEENGNRKFGGDRDAHSGPTKVSRAVSRPSSDSYSVAIHSAGGYSLLAKLNKAMPDGISSDTVAPPLPLFRPHMLPPQRYLSFCSTNCGLPFEEVVTVSGNYNANKGAFSSHDGSELLSDFRAVKSASDLHALESRYAQRKSFLRTCGLQARSQWVFFHGACLLNGPPPSRSSISIGNKSSSNGTSNSRGIGEGADHHAASASASAGASSAEIKARTLKAIYKWVRTAENSASASLSL